MLASALFVAGCGSSGGGGGGNAVFSCSVGSAAPKSLVGLFQPAPGKPGGSTTGSTAMGDGVTLYAAGTSTISGKVEYEDRVFDSSGFTGIVNKPVRYAKVQVLEDGTTVLMETTTAADGTYTFNNFSHTTGAITIRALTDSASSYAATVRDNRDSSIYAVVSADLSGSLPATLSNQNLVAGVTGAGPAFNIFDNMILAQEQLQTFSTAALAQVTAYWYDGNSNGTYHFAIGSAPSGFPFDPVPNNTPVWNFEWSVNTNFDESSALALNDLTYEMGLDFDPGPGTNFLVFDPIIPNLPPPLTPPDNSIGDNFERINVQP